MSYVAYIFRTRYLKFKKHITWGRGLLVQIMPLRPITPPSRYINSLYTFF